MVTRFSQFAYNRDWLDQAVKRLIRSPEVQITSLQREIVSILLECRKTGLSEPQIGAICAKAYARINEAVPYRETMLRGAGAMAVHSELVHMQDDAEAMGQKMQEALERLTRI